MRKRLYKKNLYLESELPELVQAIGPGLRSLANLSGKLHPAELTARYILLFWQHRLGNNLIATRHRREIQFNSAETAMNFFAESGLRYFSEDARKALLNWRMGKYPLDLRMDIPSFSEILEMQIQGRRCVSVIFDEQLLKSYIIGERDGGSFAVHDLMHAQHFFSDPTHFSEQVEFYKQAKSLHCREDFQKCFSENLDFKKQFEYAVSDMNSHPAHLWAYMQSICSQAGLSI